MKQMVSQTLSPIRMVDCDVFRSIIAVTELVEIVRLLNPLLIYF